MGQRNYGWLSTAEGVRTWASRSAMWGYIVETLIAGTLAGTFREQGKERDLTLIGTERGAARTQALDNVVLYPPRGGPLVWPVAASGRRRDQRKSSTSTATVPSN